ncbi:hypothetical protein BGW39_006708 [Mortierella sp. 14UC]|nr:hypothetical protein BGW39_006708 [Mortierella sp. 14UC]
MANANLDEFYSAEGTSEEEWQRVYDLRYCTILVPFEGDPHSNSNSGCPKEKHGSLAPQTVQVKQEPEELKEEDMSETTVSSSVEKMMTPELVHLVTPRATPARPGPKGPQSADSTPTPQKKEMDSDDQEHDMMTDDHSGLTEHDPLTIYLTADTHPRASRQPSPKNPDMDMSGDDDEAETECFHDAATSLEMDETVNSLDIRQQENPHQYNSGGDDGREDHTSSTRSDNNKRKRHWELSPSKRLLQPVEPHPSKRIALSLSSSRSQGAERIASSGLLRPRSFSPSVSPSPSIWLTPPQAGNPEQLDTSWVAAASTFWRKQDWKGLEELYDELKGESMEETELGQVVDQFLAKQDAPAEEGKPNWSREFVLLRCVALHRVRVHEKPDAIGQELYSPTLSSRPNSWRGSTPGFGNRLGVVRRSVSPYPVGLKPRARSSPAWSPGPASPGSIADFVEERRADRARQQRSAGQGSQIKSVFKHRFAAGLKTVGELLPFWKDVEKGHTDVKEEVVVPLVPAGRALSVIAAFESQAEQVHQDRQLSVPMRSRSGSVLSTTAGWNPDRVGRSVSPAPSSIAELIGRGHAARAASASSAATASTTPPANVMEHINTVCRNEGYPIVVENSPQLGNHAIASRDIPQGEGLLRAIPYAAEVFDNYKKRMCQVCLLYHNRGSFTHRCQDCDQVYFCSEACKAIAMDPQMGCHLKVCRTLRKLATWNSDRHTKSIIKLLLQVLMNHWRERQGIPTAYQSRKVLMMKEKEEVANGSGIGGDKLIGRADVEGATEKITQTLAATTIASTTPTTTLTPSSSPQPSSELNSNSNSNNSNNNDHEDENRTQEPVENDFFDVLRLQSHFEDWDDEDQKDWNKQSHVVLSLLEMAGLTEMASQPGSEAEGEGKQELHTLTSLDVKKLISALESNAFGMFDRTKKKPVCFGRAIYPIASFFNHSCECNATAVQADGSTEEVTGDAVLGLIDQENEEFNKKKFSAAGTITPSSSSLSASASASSLADTTKSESTTSTPLESGTATPVEEEEGEGAMATSPVTADPYESRVGEFRMMTFFSIRDIPKGQDITISYIDTEMPLQARRLALLTDYHFHCCCERCIREEKSGPTKTSKPTKKKSTPPKPKNKRK